MKQQELLSVFAEDILEGLSHKKKRLYSKYFYDEIGDKLFQEIMHLDEYYLTRKELEIFETHKESILRSIYEGEPIRIIELGAGDGLKTRTLLKYFLENNIDFTYSPVDISKNVLDILEASMLNELPSLKIEPYHGDYFHALEDMSTKPEKDVVFFLGSNLGNFEGDSAIQFLDQLRNYLKKGDQIFMGVDLKKDPDHILRAYDDSRGITKAFNLNLLNRINKELDGNFNVENFQHYPYYNPQTGECRSYLISKTDHDVQIAGEKVHFRAWESIFMEVSKKYDEVELMELADQSGFTFQDQFKDKDHWFSNQLWINQ